VTELRHRKSDCKERDEHDVLGWRGDWIHRCRNCRAFVLMPKPVEPEPQPAAPPANGPHRCRVHHDEPVTWKGTGCRACARERATA